MKRAMAIILILLRVVSACLAYAGSGCSQHGTRYANCYSTEDKGIQKDGNNASTHWRVTKKYYKCDYCAAMAGGGLGTGNWADTVKTPESHSWTNSGTSERTCITKNASIHVYGFYQHQKCACGATKKYYTTQTSSHSWNYSYTDKKGVKHYRCNCGQTK